jgi:hypothetical protein
VGSPRAELECHSTSPQEVADRAKSPIHGRTQNSACPVDYLNRAERLENQRVRQYTTFAAQAAHKPVDNRGISQLTRSFRSVVQLPFAVATLLVENPLFRRSDQRRPEARWRPRGAWLPSLPSSLTNQAAHSCCGTPR